MNPNDFILSILDGAKKAYNEYNILPSLTIAQAALESGWGKCTPGNNMFGIKWQDGCGYDYTEVETTEFVNSEYIRIMDKFRAYPSLSESVYDHAQFLVINPRYAPVLESTNYIEACEQIKACGYATDPNYTKSLISIIEQYELYQYDVREESKPIYLGWEEILQSVSAIPEDWRKGINLIVEMTKADSNLGDLEIFKWLPQLIEKIGNKKDLI